MQAMKAQNVSAAQDRTGKKLEEILTQENYLSLGGCKRPVNYANYTKENYDILTLKQHNDYYHNFRTKVPVYVREQPDWGRSLYKRKTNKVNQYNYIMCRNARDIHTRAANATTSAIPRSALYREARRGNSISGSRRANQSFAGTGSVAPSKESLPLIVKRGTKENASVTGEKSSVAMSHVSSKVKQEICNRSLSSYCGSKARSKSKSCSRSSVTTGGGMMTEAQRQLRRAEQLGKFMQSLGSEGAKQVAAVYGQKLIEKLKASDMTKEQMKILLSQPPEEIEKMIERALMGCGEPDGNGKANAVEEEKKKEVGSGKETDPNKEGAKTVPEAKKEEEPKPAASAAPQIPE